MLIFQGPLGKITTSLFAKKIVKKSYTKWLQRLTHQNIVLANIILLFLGDENSYLRELEVKNPAVCSMFYLITSKASCHKLYPGQFST